MAKLPLTRYRPAGSFQASVRTGAAGGRIAGVALVWLSIITESLSDEHAPS